MPLNFCFSYNVTRILNADATINLEAYRNYSPLFLSTTFAISVREGLIYREMFQLMDA